jgi:hypothetical protein
MHSLWQSWLQAMVYFAALHASRQILAHDVARHVAWVRYDLFSRSVEKLCVLDS